GYYCVDNIPPAIIPSFVELSARSGDLLNKMAIVTDIRGGVLFSEIEQVLNSLKNNSVDYKILFLDASDDVLIRRYKENRRRHPMADAENMSLSAAVKKEREMLKKIRFMSDYIIDTSHISIAQLKVQLSNVFCGSVSNVLKIQCKSFGFKYGSDTEADLVIDVRCLPNPFYVEDLKLKTGLDKEVRDYVMASSDSKEFLAKLLSFIDCSVPLYAKEGKSQLVISIGCTGGKHRSVTFAQLLGEHLQNENYNCSITHRDIYKS
ncbi:MAG: RNase adapter RapZ, partial [Acutalibacteraceae bacterium]|nr:RNase adapter RapZ [Acutalibacteraceae bacterium]